MDVLKRAQAKEEGLKSLCPYQGWPKSPQCKDSTINRLFKNNDLSSGTLKTPIENSVLILSSWDPPAHTGNTRKGPTESTIWVIEATIPDYKQEGGAHGDSAYHLALKDDDGNTMIAEIPDPDCLDRYA